MVATRTETITAGDGGTFSGHVALPDGNNGPGVLLFQEIFGVNDFLKAKAADLADLGYVVLCPDVFWRVEPDVALPHDEGALQQAYGYITKWMEIDEEKRVSDVGAALEHLRALPETAGHQVGVMGYCLGGTLAYIAGCVFDPDAVVSYYGSGIADQLTMAASLDCPVVFHFGGNDPFIPNEQVDAIRAHLGDEENVEIHVQHQAGHAFENHLAPQFHDPDAAAASWPITVDFLKRNLS